MNEAVILTKPRSDEADALAKRVEADLRGAGMQVARSQRVAGRDAPLPGTTELVVAIGGDGTVLRAQRLAVECDAPVLGVAAGRLGFLAEVGPAELGTALERLLRGDYRVELRNLIEATHRRDGEVLGRYSALNDVVLARGRIPRSLWIDVRVDEVPLVRHVADGVVVATATGSTAYALSAGGPVLAPELRNIVLTPIAAHLSIVQSVVLPGHSCIRLSLVRSQDAVLSVDGQRDLTVAYGDELLITLSERHARFVRVTPPTAFYGQLVSRLRRD